MVLQHNGTRSQKWVWTGFGTTCHTEDLYIIVYFDAVPNDSNTRMGNHFLLVIKVCSVKSDVVRLPFAWFSAYILVWVFLLIDRTTATAKIGRIVDRVKDLNFIDAVDLYATIGFALTDGFW